jgi:hypothetical protein
VSSKEGAEKRRGWCQMNWSISRTREKGKQGGSALDSSALWPLFFCADFCSWHVRPSPILDWYLVDHAITRRSSSTQQRSFVLFSSK